MVQKFFKRVEKKYLLDEKQFNAFFTDLREHMEVDEYGLHTIRNIYFDTEDDVLIRTSIEKPKYKEKFRVRCYGTPQQDSTCFLEIKKKYKGVVYKRRMTLPMTEARAYLYDGELPEKQGQIFHEIDYFIHHYNVKPKRYIAYDRIALFGKEDPEFRVTFDTNIRSREENLTLFSDEGNTYLLEKGMRLMEVKINGAMPLWFARLLSEHKIYDTSFSKYGEFYEKEVEDDFEHGIYTSVDSDYVDEDYIDEDYMEGSQDWSYIHHVYAHV